MEVEEESDGLRLHGVPIWVIVDKLTKSTYFMLVRVIYNSKLLAKISFREILRLHGMPISIKSDRGM